MKDRIDPFTVYLPHLDLHGETQDLAVYQINTFIQDNRKMGNRRVVIIHGRSTGILKNKTKEVLRKNKYVTKFYIDGENDGQTIVELKI